MIYAKWTANKYQIIFDGNGATGGSMSEKTCSYDKKVTIPANKYKKTRYRFTGWNTKKNGKGTSYKNKAIVKNLKSADGAAITLYARWKAL